MEMVAIPNGIFLMGASEEEGDADERPQHQVTVEPFLSGNILSPKHNGKQLLLYPKSNNL